MDMKILPHSTHKKYEVEYYSENRIFRRTGVQAYVYLIYGHKYKTKSKPKPKIETQKKQEKLNSLRRKKCYELCINGSLGLIQRSIAGI